MFSLNAPAVPAEQIEQIAQRVALLGVTVDALSLNDNDPGRPTAANEALRIHSLYRGSNVVAKLRLSAIGGAAAQIRVNGAADLIDELWKAKTNEQTVLQLATRIEQAYDQAHLLFHLAQIPKDGAACLAALADCVSRLHGITNLGWIVLAFDEDAGVVGTLRGQRFSAGALPIDAAAFDQAFAADLRQPSTNVIRTVDRSELARATGAEVLLQPLTFEGRRIGTLAAGNNGGDDPGLSSFETQLFAACAGYLDTFHANLARIALQERMFLGTLRALTASIDAKDPYTRGHSERVALLAQDMAIALNLGDATAERYRIAGLVHDIGKIGVPEAVLCKAGKLTDDEFAYIRKHPQIGFDILADIPGLDDIRPGVLGHHERYDGRGYPHGIAGEQIPPLARVLALADTFDAMSSNRSYRAKLPREHVLGELTRCAGTQFDPALAAIFVALDFTRFDDALHAHAEQFPAAPVVALHAAA